MQVRALVVAMLVAACGNDVGIDEPSVPELVDADGTIYQGALCTVSSDGEGPCALLCDPEALIEQYVLEGSCAIFECPLPDGTSARVGGCNL